MMELNDWYEEQYPEHCRDSCSDEHPVNADVDGSGCHRCNAIVFHEHCEQKKEIESLQRTIEQQAAEIERLKATERFLRSERPMARKLTELEGQNKMLVEACELFTSAFENGEDFSDYWTWSAHANRMLTLLVSVKESK